MHMAITPLVLSLDISDKIHAVFAAIVEPHLVHGVVQCCARRNHGSTVCGKLGAQRTLWGDVLALFVVAAVLALLTPRGVAAKSA